MFHRHSTLFGFVTTAITVVAVGQLSGWNPFWMMLTGLAGVCVLPRFFYGFAAVRKLEAEGRREDDLPEPHGLTIDNLLYGKLALPAAVAALALVFCVGLVLQMGANAMRLTFGPHGWFVIDSMRASFGYRSRAVQRDEVLDGPFAGKVRCEASLRKAWSNTYGAYCRDILYSDAKAIWRGAEPMPTGPVP